MSKMMIGPLQTMPPRSMTFFAAILLTPMAIGLLLTAPTCPIAWVVVLAGLLALVDCLRRLKLRYQIDAGGMKQQRLSGSDQLTWDQVEAVGTREIRSKIGLEGIVVRVYTATKCFRPMLRPEVAEMFLRLLHERCPKALQIDEDKALIISPMVGGKEQQSVVARHKLRLRFEHTFSLCRWSLLFVPSLLIATKDVHAGIGLTRAGRIAGITALFFIVFATTDLTALWHLRKR